MSVATMPGLSVPVSDSRTKIGVSRVDWIEERVADPVPTRNAPIGLNEDPFYDPLLRGLGLVMVLVAILNLALFGLFYWGVQFGVPGWNTNSSRRP